MTLFIYEHLTSGAYLGNSYSAELLSEGDAMISALVGDLLALQQAVVIMRDYRLPKLAFDDKNLKVLTVTDAEDYQSLLQATLENYNKILFIAPESDDILHNLVAKIEENPKKTVFNSNCQSIKLCSDKLALYQKLTQLNLMTPQTYTLTQWLVQKPVHSHQWLIKPRDGAGCEHNFIFHTAELATNLAIFEHQPSDCWLVQPYIEGLPLSLSLFIDDNNAHLLSVNMQHITKKNKQLHLTSCEAKREDLLSIKDSNSLVKAVYDNIKGLWGFVGIDLILSKDTLWIIEINPRLTSSYADKAMRQNNNPAKWFYQQLCN